MTTAESYVYNNSLILECALEQKKQQQKQTESPYMLYKTNYNNMADLSKFVDEYNKAQAMILECKQFYKSFLRSKLLTYSQLTNTSYKCASYKFYQTELKANNCGCNHILLSDIFNQYGFVQVAKLLKGYWIYNTFAAPVILATSLASAAMLEKNWNDKECPYKLKCCITDTENLYIDEVIFPKSGNIFSVHGYSHCKIKYIEYKTEKEYMDAIDDIVKSLNSEWFTLVKKYMADMFKYTSYDQLVHIDVKYLIFDNALEVLKNVQAEYNNDAYGKKSIREVREEKEKIKKIEKNLNDKIKNTVTVDLRTFLSQEEIIDTYMSFVTDIKHHYSTRWMSCDKFKKMLYDMPEFIKYIDNEVSDSIQACRQIITTYSEYDDTKLYVIDEIGNPQYYCTVKDIDDDKVEIYVKDRKLVCIYSDERTLHYSQFSQTSEVEKIRKILIFDIDTNEMKHYSEMSSKYSECIKYKY